MHVRVQAQDIKVYLGYHFEGNNPDPNNNIYQAKFLVLNPNYTQEELPTEIALLKLTKPVIPSNEVNNICFPEKSDDLSMSFNDEYVNSVTWSGNITHPSLIITYWKISKNINNAEIYKLDPSKPPCKVSIESIITLMK